MAAFTDQFLRRDPLTFNAFGMMNMWPRQIAWEARQLLEGRSMQDLDRIARAVDDMISGEAVRTAGRLSGDPARDQMSNPKTALLLASAGDPDAVNSVRQDHGDVNLLEAVEDISRPDFRPHEAFATLALWKLIDCYDQAASSLGNRLADILVVDGERYDPGVLAAKEVRSAKKAMVARNNAAIEAIEAMRACTIATQLKRQAELVDSVRSEATDELRLRMERDDELRKIKATANARRLAGARWADRAGHERQALEMVNTRAFASRAAAARWIGDNLEKSAGEFYTVETIDGWLKKAGWKPRT